MKIFTLTGLLCLFFMASTSVLSGQIEDLQLEAKVVGSKVLLLIKNLEEPPLALWKGYSGEPPTHPRYLVWAEFGDGHHTTTEQAQDFQLAHEYADPGVYNVGLRFTPMYSEAPAEYLATEVEIKTRGQIKQEASGPNTLSLFSNTNGEIGLDYGARYKAAGKFPQNCRSGYLVIMFNHEREIDRLATKNPFERLDAETVYGYGMHLQKVKMRNVPSQMQGRIQKAGKDYTTKEIYHLFSPQNLDRSYQFFFSMNLSPSIVGDQNKRARIKEDTISMNIKVAFFPTDPNLADQEVNDAPLMALICDPNLLTTIDWGTQVYHLRKENKVEFRIQFENEGGSPVEDVELLIRWKDPNFETDSDMIEIISAEGNSHVTDFQIVKEAQKNGLLIKLIGIKLGPGKRISEDAPPIKKKDCRGSVIFSVIAKSPEKVQLERAIIFFRGNDAGGGSMKTPRKATKHFSARQLVLGGSVQMEKLVPPSLSRPMGYSVDLLWRRVPLDRRLGTQIGIHYYQTRLNRIHVINPEQHIGYQVDLQSWGLSYAKTIRINGFLNTNAGVEVMLPSFGALSSVYRVTGTPIPSHSFYYKVPSFLQINGTGLETTLLIGGALNMGAELSVKERFFIGLNAKKLYFSQPIWQGLPQAIGSDPTAVLQRHIPGYYQFNVRLGLSLNSLAPYRAAIREKGKE